MADATRGSSAGAQAGWWLEDAIPGTTIRHPHGRTIDDSEHVWLAWVTHNVSDVHGDRHAAAQGPFGQPLVLGALTVAVVIGLAEPGTGDPGLVAFTRPIGWQAIRLSAPVVAGDTLRAESRVVAVRPGPTAAVGLVTRTIHGLDQAGRLVATIEEVDRAVGRRPG